MPGCDAACHKIIIDTGRIARAARFLAETAEEHRLRFEDESLRDRLTPEQKDQLHAESELDCHRAALIVAWAEERHAATVRMAGGEYSGAFEIDGVEGIRKKGE